MSSVSWQGQVLSKSTGSPKAHDDLDNDLKTIYTLRSKAAHGSPQQTAKDFEHYAHKARHYLAKAIMAILELTENGKLDLKDGKIGEAVKRLVRKQAAGG